MAASPRQKWSAALVATGAVLAVSASLRQVRFYVTHIGGSPRRTWPLEPYSSGDEPLLRLAAVGDVGHAIGRARATASAMHDAGSLRAYDAVLLLGDNVYPRGDPTRLHRTVFTPFARVLSGGTELWPILGNHDVLAGHADENVAALGMPGRWYSKRLGDVLFVGLDSTALTGEQLSWLERQLVDTDARWKIVALHHPPYSAGYQGSDLEARRLVSPIVARFGVQLVLSGHEHDYERSRVIDGVTYIVSGAGSRSRRTGREKFTAASYPSRHFLDISVYDNHLTVRAVNQDVRVFDEVEISP